MYKDYYHLQTDPFGTHPSTDTFFISETHKEAWYYLLFGIETQEPFLLLTGEYGMGKTLLCLRLIKVLKEKGVPRVLYIPTSNEGYGGILRRIASSLGISTTPEDEEILQDMIYDCFRADTEKSRFYLIIDDAHELDKKILTKLKYLSTFNHEEFFPIIMIFVGHPSFLQDLRTSELSSLNQRIKRRCNLARFNLKDTKNYIYFRLLKSGATGIPAFPDETIQKIFEYSAGVPRRINNISDTCLLIGASKKLISIPPVIVDEAIKLVDGSLNITSEEVRADFNTTEAAVTHVPFSEVLQESTASERDVISLTSTGAEGSAPGSTYTQVSLYGNRSVRGETDEKNSVTLNLTDGEDHKPEKARPKGSIYGNKLKKVATMAVAAILLILSVNMLIKYLMNEYKTLSSSPTPTVQTGPKDTPVKPEKPSEGTQALREEFTGKPSSETPVPAVRTEVMTSVPANALPKQSSGMDTKQSSKTETVSAGEGEKVTAYPFSLKSSSYQQIERAFQEISETKKLGLTPYLVKADLGDMGTLWRIYIGFYSTEEEAKKVKTTNKLINASVQKTEYACQVGEFSNETDSLNMFERLKQSGYFPYAIQKGRNLFRLYLGAYEKKSDAEILNLELQNKGIKSQVVKR